MDKLIQKQIVDRYRFCERCESKENLQGHHIITKKQSTFLRWDIHNMMCLCKSCHFWWHKAASVMQIMSLLAQLRSEYCNKYLRDHEKTIVKYSMGDLRDIYKNLGGVD